MATTLAIPLKDIALSSEGSAGLASLPEAEAVARIRQAYAFLSPDLQVAIQEGSAYLTLPDQPAHRVAEAHKTYDRAVRAAQRGEYARAIPLFDQVLQVLPADVPARRNLAMACLESGDAERAQDLLVETLLLDPRDTWSYVLLGNI